MRALTVRQPWAHSIIHLGKNVENRSRRTHHRGRIAIHAGLGWDDTGMDAIGDQANLPDEFAHGAVIGTVEIVGCHLGIDCGCEWGIPGQWHWELAHPETIEPVPAKGKLGLWEWNEADA